MVSAYEEYVISWFRDFARRESRSAPWTVRQLVERSGHSRASIFKWLRLLEVKGLVKRQMMISGRGRPKLLYRPSQTALETRPIEEVGETATIQFGKLRQICRYEKGGFCKKQLKQCQPPSCPFTAK